MIKRFKKKHIELCCNGVFLNCTYHGDLSLEHSFSTSGGYGGVSPSAYRSYLCFFLNDYVWLTLNSKQTKDKFKHSSCLIVQQSGQYNLLCVCTLYVRPLPYI